MLSIGALARHTRLSVRMLRYYDSLGLVIPERVDPTTGHRWYTSSQIGRVNSLLALKDLGFTLQQCASILDEQISVEELRGMLRLRQAELEQQIARDSARLAEVGRRLRSIERGLSMTNDTFRQVPLPAVHLLQVGSVVNDTTEIGGVPATAVGLPDHGAGIAGLTAKTLPAEPYGVSVIHRGPATEIADAWMVLDVALDERGLESHGLHRQLHRSATDDTVELQCPVRAQGAGCP
jgi:DNA-binding transcriptional MerR regulator